MTSTNKFILVAEDDVFYGDIFKTKLTKEGYDVEVATNGEEALKIARGRKPDLMLCDLIMPIKDGFETVKEMKADSKLKSVKILVLSNLGQEADIERAKKLGADEYFVKSDLSIQQMIEKVRKYVA